MVTDETSAFQAAVEGPLDEGLNAIWKLDFSREILSSAIAEISELLVAKHLGATRTARGTRGHDLLTPNGERIEVKSRFIDGWGDALQFNFRKHTKDANVVYCLAWTRKANESPHLEYAFRVPVSTLLEKWPNRDPYSARTTLGHLKRSAGKPDAEGLSLTPATLDGEE